MTQLHPTRDETKMSTVFAHQAVSPHESILGVLCDAPGKRRFESRDSAERHAKTLREPAEPYACQCGKFHVRTKQKGRPRRGRGR